MTSHPVESDGKLNLFSHVVDGQWIALGASLNGGVALKWVRDNLFSGSVSYRDLDDLAFSSVPGSHGVVLLPFFSGERALYHDSKAKAIFFGLDLATTRGDLVRATMESVAFSLRDSLETLSSLQLPLSPTVLASGGGTKSDLWLQIQADVLGRRILVKDEAVEAAKGAALLAGLGIGLWKTTAEAVQETDGGIRKTFEPREEYQEILEKNFRIYRELYQKNRSLF